MKYTSFTVKNFRGIELASLILDSKPRSNIHCLVGLNESGKTTVLEAINYFSYNQDSLDALELKGYSIDDPNTLIPISKRSNFTDSVSISVRLELDLEDEEFIAKSVKAELGFALLEPIGSVSIEQRLSYTNSKYQSKANLWTIQFRGKKKGKRKPSVVTHANDRELWGAIIRIIQKRFPGILYFPNFLFDFPDRIYLEDSGVESEKHSFYRTVLQDVLDELKIGVTIDTHIVARAKSTDESDRVSLDQLLLDASNNISKNVFSQWNKIFKNKPTQKRIILKHGVDAKQKCFVEFKIEENGALYNVTERSLGFRWFFVFFLLTFYRAGRQRDSSRVLFLFDEPASNLHQSAQAQLLKTFERLGALSQIVYTTHSHHLIDPKRLDSTHIVRNEGIHDPSGYDDQFESSKTKITVTPYRRFLSEHPDQTAYFQLILDVLDYRPSDLELVDSVVMTEGKGDYYWLKYLSEVLSERNGAFKVLPGTGSGSLELAIQLYIAWGKPFLVLLDDDSSGKREKARYLELFGPAVEGRVFTYADIDPSYSGLEIEGLLSADEILQLQNVLYPDDRAVKKTHAIRAVQEALSEGRKIEVGKSTRERITKILDFCASRLG